MKLKFRDWEDYHHQIYRIYHGIIALSLVPFFLLFLELEVAEITVQRVPQLWVMIILLLLMPICGYLSWIVWEGNNFQYNEVKELREKLVEFRRIEIKKFLTLEVVCFLGLLGLWLTAHYLFIIIYFAVLVQFSFLRPSEDRVIRNMKLTKQERESLHRGEIE